MNLRWLVLFWTSTKPYMHNHLPTKNIYINHLKFELNNSPTWCQYSPKSYCASQKTTLNLQLVEPNDIYNTGFKIIKVAKDSSITEKVHISKAINTLKMGNCQNVHRHHQHSVKHELLLLVREFKCLDSGS